MCIILVHHGMKYHSFGVVNNHWRFLFFLFDVELDENVLHHMIVLHCFFLFQHLFIICVQFSHSAQLNTYISTLTHTHTHTDGKIHSLLLTNAYYTIGNAVAATATTITAAAAAATTWCSYHLEPLY